MMKCADIRNKLTAYSDGELKPEAKALISSHLASCPGCRAELERLTALRAELALIEDVEVRPYFMTRLKQRIADAQGNQKSELGTKNPALSFRIWFRRAAIPFGAAAVVFLTAVTGSYLGRTVYTWRNPKSEIDLQGHPERSEGPRQQSAVSAGSILFDESSEGALTLLTEQSATGGK
jgi:anti-sigma factor RsiW